MEKFTKGPWDIRTSQNADSGIATHRVNDGISSLEQAIANANLIACAPEMYDMLALLLDECAISDRDHDYTDEVEELLARARGEHE